MEDGVCIYIYKSLPLSPYGSKRFLRINYHRCGNSPFAGNYLFKGNHWFSPSMLVYPWINK